jgi:arginine exporter protein ArgO
VPVLPTSAFAAGVLAGLAIALPLGAIGVLILREGVERGLRASVPAALAVALVDFAYALVAVLLGARVGAALAGWERAIQLLGAAALTVVVVLGVRSTLARATAPPGPGGPTAPTADARSSADPPTDPQGSTARVVARFVALTAINPMTAVYFLALTTGLSEQLTERGAGVVFALGVLVGSAAWQLVLAVTGALAGDRMTPRVRVAVSMAGYAIVAGYAVLLLLG